MPTGAPIRAMDDAGIAEAAALIRAGELVAFATETVYGLGADATNASAVARIYAAKGRPTFNPLISHVPDMAGVRAIAEPDERANMLAERFWPGPLTLVLPKRADSGIAGLTTAGLSSIAVRIPARDATRAFLRACGVPIAAPSANRSNSVSTTLAVHVQASLPGPQNGGPAMILDGGPCEVGLESAVVDLTGKRATLLRPGGVSREDLEAVLGQITLAGSNDSTPRSPGMMSRHYAPAAPLRMNVLDPRPDEVFLGFGTVSKPGALNLSTTGNLIEAAANLFEMLNTLDTPRTAGIAVAPVPSEGLGHAINDRLRRAAHS